ncbi:fatty acid desaturase [Moheibacter sediminis]|uniref:Stearoyl-CoA desaturase (Delta-9 desaturase) n=1 Tax=Moheibacter sediminis TaxID=1434700 RepID=A0A1W1ZUS1_9FLAO|nr:fatty acid desaturase [Moheibacter sediminis]SMC52189.1 stearoyl-CoA desaturase (delta-9 desaturase) [Moheibacter sediminis]
MAILVFLILHWYFSLFFQSVFHHRYAAHNMFTMSKFWERIFYIGCFLTQGSSYISAYAYGLMHRLHHVHTDKPEDPHSPHNDPNPFLMMWTTRNSYINIHVGNTLVENKYKKDLPEWESFDKIAHNWVVRVLWILIYILIYAWLATAWWQWLFLPITIIMGSFQGMAVNWWAHKFGYENFKMSNTSKNILPFDFIFWGEAYHNNHHKYPTTPNNARRWFEWDMGFQSMRLLQLFRIIKIKRLAV